MSFRVASRTAQAATRRAFAASTSRAVAPVAVAPYVDFERGAAELTCRARFYSDKPSPEAKASSILDALPGNSIVSKSTWVTIGAGLTAFAVSNELYVANDETVILAGFLVFATLIGRTMSGPYAEWANSTVEKISNILNEARAGHTDAVQKRIDSVGEKSDVVDATKALYALAKETLQTEKEAFELKQKTEVAAEVKSVLDSWVRFEAQQREAEQRALTESVIQKVIGNIREPKVQKEILDNAVSDIEKLVKEKKI